MIINPGSIENVLSEPFREALLRLTYNSWQHLALLPENPPQDGMFRQGFAKGENPPDSPTSGSLMYVNGMYQLPDRLWTANWAGSLTMEDFRSTFRVLSSISTAAGCDTCSFTFTPPYSGFITNILLYGNYSGNVKDSSGSWTNDGSCTVRIYNDASGELLQETPNSLRFGGNYGEGYNRIDFSFILHGKTRYRIEVQLAKLEINCEYTLNTREDALANCLYVHGRKQESVSFTRRVQAEAGGQDGLILARYFTWGTEGSVSAAWQGKTLSPVTVRTVTYRGMEAKEAEFRLGQAVPADSTVTLTVHCGKNGEFNLLDWGAALV